MQVLLVERVQCPFGIGAVSSKRLAAINWKQDVRTMWRLGVQEEFELMVLNDLGDPVLDLNLEHDVTCAFAPDVPCTVSLSGPGTVLVVYVQFGADVDSVVFTLCFRGAPQPAFSCAMTRAVLLGEKVRSVLIEAPP